MVLVTANISIKILGNLKLQLKEIHQYFHIYLNKSDIPNDSFYYMYRIEKSNSVFFFSFKFNSYLFCTNTPATSKLDDGVPVTFFRTSSTGT